jgi:hypothetical protein
MLFMFGCYVENCCSKMVFLTVLGGTCTVFLFMGLGWGGAPRCDYYAGVNAFSAADYCRRLCVENKSLQSEADALRAEMQALTIDIK